ncbi:MAG: alpha/beta hydrolase [Phycisphaeraceae bacterium]|nr:alpha/beta hydrolase [Phycisphaeraceae bacterium]
MPGNQTPGAASTTSPPPGLFEQFRHDHPPSIAVFNEVEWTWHTAGGQAASATLVLAPEPGAAAVLGALLDRLAPIQRIIAPDIPPVPDIRALIDGLAAICRTEGVSRVNLVGFGFGGVLAQCFAQRGRNVVGKVVLVNTTTPEAWVGAADRSRYNIARLAPAWLLRMTALPALMRSAAPSRTERSAWKRLLRSCLAQRRDKWELLSIRAAGFDAQRQSAEAGGWSLPGYEGRIQIIESGADRRISAAQREALKAACPGAHVRKIRDAGHWVGIVDPDEIAGFIGSFLTDVNILDRTPSRGGPRP